MTEKQKTHKITLKKGLTPKEILSIFSALRAKTIYFVIARDFSLITEINFVKKLAETASDHKTEIKFVTQKPYFQQILKRQNLEIFDILPEDIADQPSKNISQILGKIEAHKNEIAPSDFSSQKINKKIKGTKSSPSFSAKKIENLKDEKSMRSFLFFLFLVLITGMAGVFFWISPSATITINPQISVIPITQNVLIKLPGSVEGDENSKLPFVEGIFVETEIAGTETFPSSDKTYELTHARGKVTIFNETSEAKFFIPSRLESADGVILRTQKNITVPAKKDNIPGKIVVDVIADPFDSKSKPIGTRGNIDAGTELFFPSLRKETQELYYAKANRGPLVGGSTLTHYFVSENDYELAKPILHESFRVEGIDSLQQELERRSNREGTKYVLLSQPQLLKSNLLEYTTDESLIGQEQQTFRANGKVKVSGLVFDQDAIINVLQKKIEDSQDHRKKLLKMDETSIDYRVLEHEDFEDERWVKLSVSLMGIETLNLKAKSDFATQWQTELKKEIAGKEEKSANSILINHPEIKEIIKIKISPFWNKSIPSILDQINFKIVEEI